ncbi:eCIS core domain-containing protein [Streptomyces exfoliatus]|uniref:eCIS core domain-containing protein n=1 Tax=Streptomyces exfoliatus TaxID=1905 RepID=UPI00099D89DD
MSQEHSPKTSGTERQVAARAPLPPPGALNMQRTAGNAAMVQLLRQTGHPWAQPAHQQHGPGCSHQAGPGAEAPEPVQRSAVHGEPVQRSAVHDVLATAGRPLDDSTRTDMEAKFGADFSGVRIHDNSAARASAAEVGARAYTSGDHVVIGEGGGDKHTLAHELTHVIQQRQGPVAGTDNGGGLRVSDPSDRFEREAEANASRVMSMGSSRTTTSGAELSGPVEQGGAGPIQRAPTVRETRLIGQVGPSCWLYVLEAMANAYGLNTTALNAAMRSFPEKADRDARATAQKTEKRSTGVQMMGESLHAMRATIENMNGDTVTYDQLLATILTRVPKPGPAGAFANSICSQGESVRKETLIELFDKAIEKSELLLSLTSADGDEVTKILNAGQQVISPYPENGSDEDKRYATSDAKIAMGQITNFPQYMTVRKRFTSATVTPADRQLVNDFRSIPGNAGKAALLDWTARTGLQRSAHAVLLTNYDEANGFVYYKDPNVPAAEIKVTFQQFLEMAGEDGTKDKLTMRPFIAGTNGRQSNLEKLAD